MSHALEVLEFDSVRGQLVAECQTAMGSRLAECLEPRFDADAIWAALEQTHTAWRLYETTAPPSLGGAKDVGELARRAAKGVSMQGEDLFRTGESLAAMRAFHDFLSPKRESAGALWPLAEQLHANAHLERQLLEGLDGSGEVLDVASPVLAGLRRKKRVAAQRVQERIQRYLSGKTRDLLSDPIVTVRDGRYVIPVKAENRGKIKGLVHDTSGSGQTLFVEPEDVQQMGNALREVEAAERDEVVRVLALLSAAVGKDAIPIADGLAAAGELDLVLAKARLGARTGGVVPERRPGHGIVIRGGRHPLLDRSIAVPLNLELGFEQRALLITGPNTGGKTVAIKTVGLFVLMAQAGMMVPAASVALGPFTQVWADIGDEQSLEQSLSTFSGHVKNIAEALRGVRDGALVLFDEIGAGTDPAEGAALAKAVLRSLHVGGARILASTHYGELKAFAYNTEGFANAAMEFDSKTLRPTYRLLMGAPGASHALKIAERCGMPTDVVADARSMLGEAAQEVGRMMEQLETAQKLARTAQGEADRRAVEVKRREEAADRKLAEAHEVRRRAHERASGEVEETLRQLRLEAAELFEALRSSGVPAEAKKEVRAQLAALQVKGEALSDELAPERPRPATAPAWAKGASVRVEGYPQVGVLVDAPKGRQATVQIGAMKVVVPVDKLPAAAPAKPAMRARSMNLAEKAMNASNEIHLRMMRHEDALRELEKFLDDAVLGNVHQVRIVHGTGQGVLREMCHQVLRKYPGVARYRDGDPAEGGQGVTIAELD